MSNRLAEMENFFLALADKTRLRILNLIGDDEVCVCFFTEALQELQPKISRHLAYLRRAGVVETTRQGKWIFYRLVQPKDENARRVLDEIQTWMASDEQMRKDRARLTEICCAPEAMPVAIQRAPKKPVFVKEPEIEPIHAESRRTSELEEFLL
jgi:ArsR family transcriptional regulator, arsenate/arsenite/antimonite-responsive transcriptional repressor